jgi:predicted lactoylglutathione lyase
MEMQLGMLVLEVRDLEQSIAFYRLLGLDLPEPEANRPSVLHRMGSGVTLVLAQGFAVRTDPMWVRPEHGYQQLMEFYAGGNADVDAVWKRMTDAGYASRMAPVQTAGPYAAMVDDPDGNVVLLSSDRAARIDR